ncbi:MAG: carboxypeptidase regulatory-like domain-containing protein [Planctomycetota bacterium]
MSRRLVVECGALLWLAAGIAAQEPGLVRGVVFDKDFDAPVPEAKVSILEVEREVATNDQGNFVIGQVPAGRYTLVVAKEGYVRHVAEVVVPAGQFAEVNVWLAGDFHDMEEFVVQDLLQTSSGTESALLQLRFDSPALLDSVSADLIGRAGASDAAGALRLVAGASVQNGKSAVIRGLPDRYVSSQMNGMRLPSADEDKRAVELDQFPAAVIESIQVSKTFTPDQQGDASGGAVNVRLKGVPDEPFFIKVQGQVNNNSQVAGRRDFLSYEGGGVHFWGKDGGGRRAQTDRLDDNWQGAVGVTRIASPLAFKSSGSMGGKHDFGDGTKIGGLFSFFHEHGSSFARDGRDDTYWVVSPGAGMTPRTSQGTVLENDFKTALFDLQRSSETVQWGTLGTAGIEGKNNSINLFYLYTRTAEDSVSLGEDTRGKEYYYPGFDPDNPDSPGHDYLAGAPYLRLETLEYSERTTDTFQLNGRHKLPFERLGVFGRPEVDWTAALSSADLTQPDKRQFGSLWQPGRRVGTVVIPPTHYTYKPGANFTFGNLQRIWKDIEEESEQYTASLKLPFATSEGSQSRGYLKVGAFRDRVKRTFDQNTYSNLSDNSSYAGEWEVYWSRAFPYENHPIAESKRDVDYRGRQNLDAWYVMADLPLFSGLNLIGGMRFEGTELGIVNDPEEDATWFPPGSVAETRLNPGDADVTFRQTDKLPSVGLVFVPVDALTLRASYTETLARQTFKEITPILQQEYLGAPLFIGNPSLQMSSLKNYDLRADFVPAEGTLLSASWFKKDVEDAIEYVQRITVSFDYTTATNYPEGRLTGWEFEARQDLGKAADVLAGLSVGANATLIHSRVTLPADEAAGFEKPGIQAPMPTRHMTNAPEHLYNAFVTYDLDVTRTKLALFYTVQGDTLIAGAGEAVGNFVPNVYAKEFDTLNFSLTQSLGRWTWLQFRAKNLTNPRIDTVYRSSYIGDDVLKTSYSNGIEYSLSLGGEVRF